MPTIDFESLTKPVSVEEPCGPDLELGGDLDYMNFVAGAEGLLPRSYFGRDQAGNEGRPFDRNSINFEAQFNAAQPFLQQTRDLRLLGILAKFSILNRDLAGFITCIRAIGALLSDHWDEVHPRAEDGDLSFRMVTIELIHTLPTIIMPLQFLPLVEHKRLGSISYRGYMIAKGQLQPAADEEPATLPNLEKILAEVDLSELVERRGQIADLQAALIQIRQVWQEKSGSGPSVSLERLPESASQIFALLNATIVQRDPGASLSPAEPDINADEGEADPSQPGAVSSSARIASSAAAARALAAVADYFSQHEPSSPALLLVRQASHLLGKSFVEVMRILVPTHVESASFNIGRDQFFDLPIERLATFAPEDEGRPTSKADGDAAADPLQPAVKSRTEALALLEQIGAYFRTAEPTSPIPFLTERARDLAQRDFLSVLKSFLPPDTLKPPDSEK